MPHKLVMAGFRRREFRSDMALVKGMGLERDMTETGFVEESQPPALCSTADWFVSRTAQAGRLGQRRPLQLEEHGRADYCAPGKPSLRSGCGRPPVAGQAHLNPRAGPIRTWTCSSPSSAPEHRGSSGTRPWRECQAPLRAGRRVSRTAPCSSRATGRLWT